MRHALPGCFRPLFHPVRLAGLLSLIVACTLPGTNSELESRAVSIQRLQQTSEGTMAFGYLLPTPEARETAPREAESVLFQILRDEHDRVVPTVVARLTVPVASAIPWQNRWILVSTEDSQPGLETSGQIMLRLSGVRGRLTAPGWEQRFTINPERLLLPSIDGRNDRFAIAFQAASTADTTAEANPTTRIYGSGPDGFPQLVQRLPRPCEALAYVGEGLLYCGYNNTEVEGNDVAAISVFRTPSDEAERTPDSTLERIDEITLGDAQSILRLWPFDARRLYAFLQQEIVVIDTENPISPASFPEATALDGVQVLARPNTTTTLIGGNGRAVFRLLPTENGSNGFIRVASPVSTPPNLALAALSQNELAAAHGPDGISTLTLSANNELTMATRFVRRWEPDDGDGFRIIERRLPPIDK